MDFKKLSIFVILAAFLGVAIFLACSSTEDLPVIYPSGDEIVVGYISSTQQPPTIDGDITDAIWETAQPAQLISVDTSEYNPKKTVALLNVIALSDSNNLYVAVSWKDNTEDIRYRQWIWDTASANDPNEPYPWRRSINYREDNIAFFFDPDPNGTDLSPSASEPGPDCAMMCHATDLVMYNDYATPVDGWYWRAGVTNPIEHAIDLNFVDSLETDSRFLGLDAEDHIGYLLNVTANASVEINPTYWHKVDTTVVGTDTSFTIYNLATLFDTDTVSYSSEEFIRVARHEEVDSVFVPSYVLSQDASGSRWDVKAVGTFDASNNRWTVEFMRPLNTGNADDIVFEPGHEYGVVIAISNNTKQPHTGFDPVLLKF